MELHYLWIKEYKSLREADICLSARYTISISKEGKIFRLKIDHNPQFIPNFLGKSNISNVTAIVGQNGTGKSTVLEYIKNHLPSGMLASINNDIIVYTEDKRTGVIRYPLEMELVVDDSTGVFLNGKKAYENIDINADSISLDKGLAAVEYINYSFFLDHRNERQSYSGLYDISTNALLVEHRYQAEEPGFKFSPDIDYLIGNDLTKAIQLFSSDIEHNLPFDKPDELWMYVNEQEITTLASPDKSAVRKLPEEVSIFFRRNKSIIDIRPPEQRLENLFYLAALANFLYTEHTYGLGVMPLDIVSGGSDVRNNVRDFLGAYSDSRHFEGEVRSLQAGSNGRNNLLAFFDYFDKLLASGKITIQQKGEKEFLFVFPLNKELEIEFKEFMRRYMESKGLSAYLDFSWRGLSTGQQSWLSFLARIHHVRFHAPYADRKNNVVFLIDEGDAGYHPEWQRMFFKHTLNFISHVFADTQIQLILTTNTPFLASDLITPHILFFERQQQGQVIIHDKRVPRNNTFGGNITELFMESFYLNGFVIGEFAKDIIERIIAFLNNKKETVPREDYFKIIEQIGDDIIRNKLLDMWAEKFDDFEEEKVLRKRLDEIQKRRNSR